MAIEKQEWSTTLNRGEAVEMVARLAEVDPATVSGYLVVVASSEGPAGGMVRVDRKSAAAAVNPTVAQSIIDAVDDVEVGHFAPAEGWGLEVGDHLGHKPCKGCGGCLTCRIHLA